MLPAIWVSILISASLIFFLIFSILIFYKNKKNKRNLFLSAFSISSGLLVGSAYFSIFPLQSNPSLSLFLSRVTYASIVLTFTFLYLFSLVFPVVKRTQYIISKVILGFSGILFILSLFSPLIASGIKLQPWGFDVTHGALYNMLFLPYMIAVLFLSAINFIRQYKSSTGNHRAQLQYFLLGLVFFSIIGIIYNVVVPIIIGNQQYYNIGNASSIFIVIFTAIAIVRYRLMDIRVVIRKGLVYAISLIIVLALYTYFALLLKSTIENYWNLNPGWTAFILVALVALGFPPLKNIVERSINTLFKGKKSIDLAVKEVQEKMANKTDIESLIDLISQEIRKFLGLEEVEILLINRQEKKFTGQERSLDFSQSMVKYLQEKGEILVKEEIPHMLEADHEFDHKELKEVENKMSKLNIAVAIPVGKGEELIGLILLGKKKSHDAFTIEDIKFLEKLSGQALFALGNAVLYRDAMERIRTTYLQGT